MPKNQNQRSILITGCSTGIGRYCAIELAKNHNWHVIATVRKEQDKQSLQSLELTNLDVIFCEMADDNSIELAFSQALELANGELDALFNNAAYGQVGAIEDIPTKAWQEQMQVNFIAVMSLSRLAIAHMRKRNTGRIIMNSSVLGFVNICWRGAYCASKYALESACDGLRIELLTSCPAIKVISIQPGPIISDFNLNAAKTFYKYIQPETSAHQARYAQHEQHWQQQNRNSFGTLGPEAVCAKLVHALESKNPKTHYMVTTPTYIMKTLRWLLPRKLFDKIANKMTY